MGSSSHVDRGGEKAPKPPGGSRKRGKHRPVERRASISPQQKKKSLRLGEGMGNDVRSKSAEKVGPSGSGRQLFSHERKEEKLLVHLTED